MDKQAHWENVYATKSPNEVSWTQEVPNPSLDYVKSFDLPLDSSIIDIGGGDSLLVDHLLDLGYSNITVLDISSHALDRAKKRLGAKSEHVKWIVADITEFQPETQYDVWHDRAVFHFLTEPAAISSYKKLVFDHVRNYLIMGTFSTAGPTKCSGLEIKQYDSESLPQLVTAEFDKITCETSDHLTPFNTVQNFVFCTFKRKI